jgi:hypothetical protein
VAISRSIWAHCDLPPTSKQSSGPAVVGRTAHGERWNAPISIIDLIDPSRSDTVTLSSLLCPSGKSRKNQLVRDISFSGPSLILL